MIPWIDQFKVIKDSILSGMLDGKPPTLQMIADIFDVKFSKVKIWASGQRPGTTDLETISRITGISPRWLLLGKGEIISEKIPEDIPRVHWPDQYKIIMNLWLQFAHQNTISASALEFSKRVGISTGKHQAWKNGQRPSPSDLIKLICIFRFSPIWLLTGIGSPIDNISDNTETARPEIATQDLSFGEKLPLIKLTPAEAPGHFYAKIQDLSKKNITDISGSSFIVSFDIDIQEMAICSGMEAYFDPEVSPAVGDLAYIQHENEVVICNIIAVSYTHLTLPTKRIV